MTEREYKAVHTMPVWSNVTKSRQSIAYLYSADRAAYDLAHEAFVWFVQKELRVLRASLIANAREELRGDDRQDHLLNAYVEWNEDRDSVTATYVFSNRDTAILFKLSL